MAGEQLIQGRGWGLEKSRIQVCSEASACLGSGGPLWGGGWGSQTWEPMAAWAMRLGPGQVLVSGTRLPPTKPVNP